MKRSAIILVALALAGCAPASVSRPLDTTYLLNRTTVGGPDYPIVIEGAESVGLNPVLIAQNMRFPAGLPANSSFRAVSLAEAPPTHAHLRIGAGTALTPATLTFVDRMRPIGSGTFSIPYEAYRDPQALGSVSSVLISDMLVEARRGSGGRLIGRNRFY